ncbi:Pregnancy-specific beta-1-glycoprotein 8 [Camelus dromedarius]|uniref:Pregnancy-specific beta-1-glycoprotein 8 n=1 Tax=Camelus dromedarius TaxID=9838 RepID=A0A5N4DR44_CAMDR|nr:Pregnancy-specific beta-1-glycoprotein 8 [Camelus dromedarius]
MMCSCPRRRPSTERGRTAELTHHTAVLVGVSGVETLLTEGGTQQTADTMEPSSAPAHRGHVLWQRVLLAVSLLTFWNLPTTTQLSIESVPVNAAEGTDVLLLVYNVTEDLLGYGWFKGEKVENSQQIASYIVSSQVNVPGPAYSGRETIYANGSLLFQNVFQNDTGYYTIIVTTNHFDSKAASGQLRVFPKLPTPVVTSNNLNPLEHEDTVVLTCEPETQNTTYMWWINNRSLPDSTRLELSEDNRTLTLLHVTRNDTGPYVCETQNPVSAGRSDPFTLNVLSKLPTPVVTSNNLTPWSTKDTVVLTCEPETQNTTYMWWINNRSLPDSTRLELSEDNRTLTLLHVTRNDTGPYVCETQNPVSAGRSDPFTLNVLWQEITPALSTGAIVGIVVGILVAVVLVAALGCFYFLARIKSHSCLQNNRVRCPPASTPGHGPSGSSVSLASQSDPKPAVPIYQELLHSDRDIYYGLNHKADVVSSSLPRNAS